MRIANEKGRSMIEMLGVLAIIGVLSVGSLSIVGKARQQFTISQIINETTTLIINARKMTCDYDSGYESYVNMMYQSEAFPDGVSAKLSNGKIVDKLEDGKATRFVLSSDAEVSIASSGTNNSTFTLTLSNIPEEACVSVLSADWNSNGLVSASTSASAGGDDEGEAGSSNSKNILLDDAATACSGSAPQLVLVFGGCSRADQE